MVNFEKRLSFIYLFTSHLHNLFLKVRKKNSFKGLEKCDNKITNKNWKKFI